MTLRTLREAWDDFFFAPQSPIPIALFRILYGISVSVTVILLHSDWLNWFGVHGWVTLSTMRQVEPGMRLNLFTVMPQDDRWIAAFFWVFLGFALLLTAGVWTRLSSVVVFLCLTSIDQRNLLILHGGDTFLRVAGFFLMFAPAGAAFSVDRLIRVRRGLEGPQIQPRAPWAQRMIQLELALLYFTAFWWKMKGHTWLNGTALYYVLHLHSIARFPVPRWIQSPAILKAGSWFTLALEFSLGVLIWFRRFRYPLLLLGLLFHLGIEYALNLPMFSWDVITGYILFIDPSDLDHWWRSVRQRLARIPLRKRYAPGEAHTLQIHPRKILAHVFRLCPSPGSTRGLSSDQFWLDTNGPRLGADCLLSNAWQCFFSPDVKASDHLFQLSGSGQQLPRCGE